MDRLLRFLLKTFIRRGTFRVTTSRGTVLTFGDGTGQPVSVRFATRAAEWGILLDPELKFGEAYMDGTFVVEQGSIADVLAIMLGQNTDVPHWARLQGCCAICTAACSQFNPRKRSRRNVAHHYDLDGRLYSLFLDADRQYSCAYFEKPGPVARRRATRQEAPSRGQALLSPTAPDKICACSTSAAAGAGLGFISPRLPAPTSPASRCRRSSTPSPTSARPKRA